MSGIEERWEPRPGERLTEDLEGAEALLHRIPGLREIVERGPVGPAAASLPCDYCGASGEDRTEGCTSGNYPSPLDPGRWDRCPRAAAADRAERVRVRREKAGINRRYSKMTFDTFDAYSRALRNVRDLVERYVALADERLEDGRGLLLVGDYGAGKSHLGYAAINALILAGHDAHAIEADKYLDVARESRSFDPATAGGAEERLRLVETADFLLLEDLGKQRVTDFALEKLHSIMTERWGAYRPTLVTTNEPPDGPLAAKVGGSVESRLYEMCDIIEMRGEDYRRRKRKEGGQR